MAIGTFPNEPIAVVLYTQEQFVDITRSPSWAAAAFDGRIRVPMRGALQNPAELDRILCHELTHAFVLSVAPRSVPQWLNEGLALLFEPSGARSAGSAPSRLRGEATGPIIPLTRPEGRPRACPITKHRAHAEGQPQARRGSGMPAILNLLQNVGAGNKFGGVRAGDGFNWFNARSQAKRRRTLDHRFLYLMPEPPSPAVCAGDRRRQTFHTSGSR
jgi:hypothetical protein